MIQLKKHFKHIESKMSSLPEKLNFKIGETSSIIGVPNHVLRYWEKEFPTLKPDKFINNQRIYLKKDIKVLLLIKILLYEEKFSIEGLRKHLKSYYQQLKNYNSKDSDMNIETKLKGMLSSLSKMRETLNQAQL